MSERLSERASELVSKQVNEWVIINFLKDFNCVNFKIGNYNLKLIILLCIHVIRNNSKRVAQVLTLQHIVIHTYDIVWLN